MNIIIVAVVSCCDDSGHCVPEVPAQLDYLDCPRGHFLIWYIVHCWFTQLILFSGVMEISILCSVHIHVYIQYMYMYMYDVLYSTCLL